MVIRTANRMQQALAKPEPAAVPATKDCPYCCSAIPVKATRCAHCTSNL
jgi:large conductance mechanosensitive channel